MKENAKKLTLNQETLRNLSNDKNNNFLATHNTCVRSVCGPACTPAPGMN